MINANQGKLINMPAATAATTATQSMVIDTKGHDQCNIYVNVGTHATNGTTLTTLKVTESDTATLISSQSAIVALTGGTATSTSVGFVIPVVASAGNGHVFEFQIDCKKRKRYLGLQITPGATTINVGAIARLTRSDESADSATEKAFAGTSNISLTRSTSVLKIAQA